MRHSWPRRTPMKLISEGPPSYRGSASSCRSARRSACRHRRPRRLRSATAGYREWLSVSTTPPLSPETSADAPTRPGPDQPLPESRRPSTPRSANAVRGGWNAVERLQSRGECGTRFIHVGNFGGQPCGGNGTVSDSCDEKRGERRSDDLAEAFRRDPSSARLLAGFSASGDVWRSRPGHYCVANPAAAREVMGNQNGDFVDT